MGIGTSLGAYYEDSLHMAVDPFLLKPTGKGDEIMEVSPQAMIENKKADAAETNEFGPGLEASAERPADVALAGMKSVMPFPDNRNPDSEFNSRFGTLPPSGILNDLKKPTGDPSPMVRKINDDGMSGVKIYGLNPMIESENGTLQMGGGTTPFRGKPNNDNAADTPMYGATKIDQLARKLGEAENGKGSWDRIGGGGQEHYYRDARRALRNDDNAGQIENKAMDAHVDRTWNLYKTSQEKAGQAEMLLRKKDFSEFDAARVKKLQKEAQDAINEHNDMLNQ